MRVVPSLVVCVVAVSLFCLSGIAPAQAEEEPQLSAEIKKVLDALGPEAALSKFNELFPAQKDRYKVDLEGFGKMANSYAQAGEMEKMQAVIEMTTLLAQDTYGAAIPQSGMKMPEPPPEPEQPEPEPAPTYDAGPARGDLERFVGLYSDPEKSEKTRALFAAVSCDGYLVVGATWGDAANWWMKSVADRKFEYADSFTQLKLEFDVGADGEAVAMNHDLDFMPNPLKHIVPLPEELGKDCIKRPLR
jgi:hypothetical protein